MSNEIPHTSFQKWNIITLKDIFHHKTLFINNVGKTWKITTKSYQSPKDSSNKKKVKTSWWLLVEWHGLWRRWNFFFRFYVLHRITLPRSLSLYCILWEICKYFYAKFFVWKLFLDSITMQTAKPSSYPERKLICML